MALNLNSFKTTLRTIYSASVAEPAEDPADDMAAGELDALRNIANIQADALATAIHNYLLTATVTTGSAVIGVGITSPGGLSPGHCTGTGNLT